jgi:putative membrane protein
MQKKLWFIIGWPGAIGALIFGTWMIIDNLGGYLAMPWMWLKLIFVGFLILYHMQCHFIFNKQKQNIFKWNSFQLRLFNELATVFLVAIVFLVVVKSTGSLVWSLLGLFLFAALLMAFVTIYRNMREKEKAKKKSETESTSSDSSSAT